MSTEETVQISVTLGEAAKKWLNIHNKMAVDRDVIETLASVYRKSGSDMGDARLMRVIDKDSYCLGVHPRETSA